MHEKRKENGMKNITSLQILMAMGLVIGSTSVVEAYNGTNKYASKETKSENCKSSMKSIEHDLNKIQSDFKRSHDARMAHEKLDAMPARIKHAVAKMKKMKNMANFGKHTNIL